ncbi:MAG TPA: hypothetical protein DCF87_08625 [Opitutae bacterium]|nr:hypothetical protein [Opitutae bacterium]
MNGENSVRIGRENIVGIGDGQCLLGQPVGEIFTMGREKFRINRCVSHVLSLFFKVASRQYLTCRTDKDLQIDHLPTKLANFRNSSETRSGNAMRENAFDLKKA